MKEKILSDISKIYAQALFETATEDNQTENYSKQLDQIRATFESANDLQVVISNSAISIKDKSEILNKIFKGKIETKLLNFLKILLEKDRIAELDAISSIFKQMTDSCQNKKTIEIISPIELNFENKTKILFKLEKKFKSEISPIWSIDKNLIAGLVFRYEDYTIDTSVRSKLKDLKNIINRG